MQTRGFKKYAVVLTAGAAVAGILAANVPIVNGWLKNAAYTVSQPFQRMVWSAGAGTAGFFTSIAKMGSSARENDDLRGQVNELRAEISNLKRLEEENNELRGALGIGLEKEFKLKLAHIIARDVAQDSLIINAGSDDMIQVGYPIITGRKVIVGRVSKVYRHFSVVTLATARESSFDANIADSDIDGLVRGQGGLNMVFDLVAKDKEIKPDSLVETGTLGGIFPQGLVVGRISDVKKNDVEMFQKATIVPEFNIESLNDVFAIIGHDVPQGGMESQPNPAEKP